ncbi:MAG: hypothetical protein WEA35_03815 [Candidatus Nanopelagicales bacterium]
MSSAATDPTDLQERLGGRWFGSWAVWAISMPFGLLVMASDLAAATSAYEVGQRLLVWLGACAITATILAVLHRTLLRSRSSAPLSVRASVITGGCFGACYGLSLWAMATLLGLTSLAPWPLRVLVVILIGLWWIPFLTVAVDLVTSERAQRRRDIDALVEVELLRLREVDVVREMRAEIDDGVRDALDPVRQRIDRAVREAEAGALAGDAGLPIALREAADTSVRPMSRDLWRVAAARYPRTPWEVVLERTLRTQPLRTVILATLAFIGDGLFVIAERGWQEGVPYAIVTLAAVVLICATVNVLMARHPRHHMALFIVGIGALQVLSVVVWIYRETVWQPAEPLVLLGFSITSSIFAILLTSGFGSWRSEMIDVRGAFRAEVAADRIAAIARGRSVGEVTRDVARELHGSVQTRLVACAMAMEKASSDGNAGALSAALTEARLVLATPLAESASAPTVAEEVRRKVALWGDLCTFTTYVDPAVEGWVDPSVVGRVVEEGLTNAIRHGVATTVDVHVQWDGSTASVSISDNGAGPQGGPAGLGSALMHQATAGRWELVREGELTQLRAKVTAAAPAVHP